MKLLIVVLFLFSAMTVSALEIVKKEWDQINGIQVFVMPDMEMDKFFAELKKQGVNTVFFRVFHNKNDRVHSYKNNPCPDGGVYFSTNNACVVDDILDSTVHYANKHGIKLYAWMATRSLSFLKSKNMSESYTPQGISTGYGANIFDPEIAVILKKLFKDLADRKLDGILIQDDFIYKYSEGADFYACEAYLKDTGQFCSVTNFFGNGQGGRTFNERGYGYDHWVKWKASRLQLFLTELRSSIRLINPKLKWAVNIYYETPVFPERGLSWYAQELDGLWNAGIDYISVMAYEEQIKEELSLSNKAFFDLIESIVKGSLDSIPDSRSRRAVFKLQVKSFKNASMLPKENVYSLCKYMKQKGGSSFIMLPVSSLDDVSSVCR